MEFFMTRIIKSGWISVALVGLLVASGAASAQTSTAPAPVAPVAPAASAASSPFAKKHHAAEVFQMLDVNKDGLLSRDEVKSRPRLEKNFDVIDANKDGQLSPAEFKAYRQANKRR
jgi:Ca2+-binding EF-hand superfamily protein